MAIVTQSQAASRLAPEPAESSPGYARYVLGLLVLVYVVNFVDRQILVILLHPIKQDLGVSDTAMGFLTGFAFSLFYAVAGIPIARWADTGQRRTVIALGLAVWSAMTAASGLARSFTQLALARVGVGIGEAAGSPPAHSLISDYFPPARRATALAIYSAGLYVGYMVGYLLGGWINEFFGWRSAFFVVGLPGLLLALVVRLTLREPPRGPVVADEVDSAHDVLRFIWRRRSLRHLVLAGATHAFVTYGSSAWSPTFLIRVHGMRTGEIGTWLGLIAGVAGGAGAVLGGVLCDRLAARDARWHAWLVAIAVTAGLPFSLCFQLWPAPHPALLWNIPAVFFSSFWLGPTVAMIQGLVKPRMRAMASAILLFAISLIGLGVGPQAIGILNDLLAPRLGAHAVRYSLVVFGFVNLWSAAHYLMAARTLRADLRET
ncbi:MAG TPA: MFS transporter [Candidatus Nitrosopolaris sp.]|nr:MFS transporter [Candidatus Nitrosopolaris sp.]